MIQRFQALILALCALFGAVAYADSEEGSDMDLRPSWSSSIVMDPNNSFLNDRNHREGSSFLNSLVDDKRSAQMRQDLQDLNRDYELKSSYGLSGLSLEQSHFDQMNGFARGAVNQVQRYQLDQTAKSLKTSAEQNPDIAKPAEAVGGAAAVATGTPVRLKVDEETTLQSKTNLARQRSEFNLFSGYLNASVQVNMLAPSMQDPGTIAADPSQRDERYKLAVNRNLPIWDLSSGLTYGSTTSSLCASVSKRLTENLTAVIDSSRLPDRNAGTVKLNYGLHF